MDDNQHIGDQLEQKAQKTAHAVKAGAQAGKAIGKAAGKAASGDIAGAAVTLATNETTRRSIVLVVILAFFVPIIILGVFLTMPLMIYEHISVFIERAEEAYKEARYAGDQSQSSGIFSGILAAIGSAIRSLTDAIAEYMSDLWSSINSNNTTIDPSQRDKGGAADQAVMSKQDAVKEIVERKIESVQRKINARVTDVYNRVDSAYRSYASATLNEKVQQDAQEWYDENKDAILGVYAEIARQNNIDVSHPVIIKADNFPAIVTFAPEDPICSKTTAYQLIVMLSAMRGGDPTELKTSEVLRWLGYRSSGTSTISVGGAQCEIPTWTGTFMPMYLFDEKLQNEHLHNDTSAYNSKGAPALDLMMSAYGTDVATAPIQVVDYELNVETETGINYYKMDFAGNVWQISAYEYYNHPDDDGFYYYCEPYTKYTDIYVTVTCNYMLSFDVMFDGASSLMQTIGFTGESKYGGHPGSRIEIPVPDTYRQLSINGSIFRTVSDWNFPACRRENVIGVGGGSDGWFVGMIPVHAGFTGQSTKITIEMEGMDSMAGNKLHYYILNERDDNAMSRSIRSRSSRCIADGTMKFKSTASHNWIRFHKTFECPVQNLGQTFYIYIKPESSSYGNIHMSGKVIVTIYTNTPQQQPTPEEDEPIDATPEAPVEIPPEETDSEEPISVEDVSGSEP